MGFGALAGQLFDDLLKAGASPAVQAVVLRWIVNHPQMTPDEQAVFIAHLKKAPADVQS